MPERTVTGPLLLWLAIQLSALTFALLRLPLVAVYSTTGELLAAHVLIVTQVVASALLFPFLLRTAPAAVAVIAGTWPFVVLGGAMSATPPARVAITGVYVSAWLAALWAWRAACPTRHRFSSVAVATLLTAGSMVLLYLRLDLSNGTLPDAADLARRWAAASPPLAALCMLDGQAHAQHWGIPSAIAGASLVCLFLARRTRQVIHSA